MIEAMGGVLEKIEITSLEYLASAGMATFIAALHIRQNGQVLKIDSRPSDAIALWAAANIPIYVADSVMDQAAGEPRYQPRCAAFMH